MVHAIGRYESKEIKTKTEIMMAASAKSDGGNDLSEDRINDRGAMVHNYVGTCAQKP